MSVVEEELTHNPLFQSVGQEEFFELFYVFKLCTSNAFT